MARVSGEPVTTHDRVQIGALRLHRVGLSSILEQISQFLEEKRPRQVVTVNLQFLSTAAKNRTFAEVVNSADLVVADGMPLLWLSRLLGTPIPQRVTGHDLLHHCAALAAQRGFTLFFLGATSVTAEKATRRLQEMYPGLKIVGSYQGSFSQDGYGLSESDERGALDAIRRCGPDFLFVALGCPKQELWIHRHRQEIEVPVCIGIGGVLDVLAGRLRRAPSWMQRMGLEWLYRLQQEPGRLWKRYLTQDFLTALKITAAITLKRTVNLRHMWRTGGT
jgi:N-acetylglucosaminyldiphosphoundecaprenol N-acetyl-beta-D-mannosaminyltransferase